MGEKGVGGEGEVEREGAGRRISIWWEEEEIGVVYNIS